MTTEDPQLNHNPERWGPARRADHWIAAVCLAFFALAAAAVVAVSDWAREQQRSSTAAAFEQLAGRANTAITQRLELTVLHLTSAAKDLRVHF
ncbi:MAG: hypothetical protein RJA10_845, partial [Pseudomonadota bacterium]